MRSSWIMLVPMGAALLSTAGCYYTGTHGIVRVWADYNTLQRPALIVEEVDHWPNSHDRLVYFNSMYRGTSAVDESLGGQRVRSNSTGTLAVPPAPELFPVPGDTLPETMTPLEEGSNLPPLPQDAPDIELDGPTASRSRPGSRSIRANTTVSLRAPERGGFRAGGGTNRLRPERPPVQGAWLFSRP